MEIKPEQCDVCTQPMQSGHRSKRRATSVRIIMPPNFQDYVTIPCHFRERLNDYADKWLSAMASGCRYEFFLVKEKVKTYVYGPFWTLFVRAHNIALNDVVTFTFPNYNDDEDDDEADDNEDNNEADEDNETSVDYVFDISVVDSNGNNKPLNYVPGLIMLNFYPPIRAILHKTVFTNMHLVTEAHMAAIIWEMMKEVNRQIWLHEDDFYHVLDLQYIVHYVSESDIASRELIIPAHIARGYKNPRIGVALYLSYTMHEPISGQYTIHKGQHIIFRNGWENFCNINNIVAGSMIAVRVEMRESSIGLFVERL